MTVPYFVLQLLLAGTMIGIGTYLVVVSLWKVGASAERRGALANQAGEIDVINELSGRRINHPTIPFDATPPVSGLKYPYRLRSTKRNLWGLIGSASVWVLFVILAVILVIIGYAKFQMNRADWYAGGLAIPFLIAAIWSFYYFVRQLLKLASIGPTVLEISSYPVVPGQEYQVFLSQSGRNRIKLLDITLECSEVATFDQGTNIRTESQTVFSQRLYRKRGVSVSYHNPFCDEFQLLVPAGAMHSFSSASNRIQWKIEIYVQAKGFPRLKRSIEIIVLPPTGMRQEESESKIVSV